MSVELYIAKTLLFKKKEEGQSGGTRPVIRIAIAAVVLSIMVMIISICIVTGFQKEIRNKLIGFGSHVQISSYASNSSYELEPIQKDSILITRLRKLPQIDHVQVFATKAGIIKTESEIEGVVLKGVDKGFNWEFFNSKLVSGRKIDFNDTSRSNEALISSYTSKRLNLNQGDALYMYFIQQPPRMRKFKIVGIYETGLEDLDKLYVLCDIQQIRKLNDWKAGQIAGYEVLLKDFKDLEGSAEVIYNTAGYNLNAKSIKELYPQVFDWLSLQDINVTIIIILMLIVASINMITALLIMILERVNMIGILKAMGAQNVSIRRIFLYLASYLSFTGIVIGNIISITFCVLQQHFHFLKLSQESYYVSYVPISINPLHIILLNAGTLLICFVAMILPSIIVSKITPVSAIRFQ